MYVPTTLEILQMTSFVACVMQASFRVGGGYFGLTTITEAEALKPCYLAIGYDETDGRALPPVPRSVTGYQTGWYDAWYRIAVNQNIIRDFADPNSPIPRERYAVLAARTWKKSSVALTPATFLLQMFIQDPSLTLYF